MNPLRKMKSEAVSVQLHTVQLVLSYLVVALDVLGLGGVGEGVRHDLCTVSIYHDDHSSGWSPIGLEGVSRRMVVGVSAQPRQV